MISNITIHKYRLKFLPARSRLSSLARVCERLWTLRVHTRKLRAMIFYARACMRKKESIPTSLVVMPPWWRDTTTRASRSLGFKRTVKYKLLPPEPVAIGDFLILEILWVNIDWSHRGVLPCICDNIIKYRIYTTSTSAWIYSEQRWIFYKP